MFKRLTCFQINPRCTTRSLAIPSQTVAAARGAKEVRRQGNTTLEDYNADMNRHHVTPHAHWPRLLHAAQEADSDSRADQTRAMIAYTPVIYFSGILRALQEFCGL